MHARLQLRVLEIDTSTRLRWRVEIESREGFPNLSFAAPAKSYFSTCPPEPRPDWRMALLILNTGVVVHVDLGEIHGHLPSLRLRRRGELASPLNQDPLRLGAHRVAFSKSPAPRVLSEPSVRSFGSTSPCAPSDDSLEKHLPPSWTPSTPALREWLRPSVSPSLRLPARASIVSSDEQGLRRRSHVQEGHERHHHLPKPPKPPRRG